MKADLYTKVVLTVLAVLLAVQVARWAPMPVRADDFEPNLQFDPGVHQLDVPNGSASLSGRIAIDTRSGNVYGFPTNSVGYPRDLQHGAPAISQPIYLGRFDLRNLPRR